jgi:hypothetical protein
MKTKTSSLLVVGVCLMATALSFTACAQLKNWVTKPGDVEVLRPAETNLVQTLTTNTLENAAVTNTDGTIVPPHTVFTIVTNLTPVVTPPVYFTNLALAPIVQSGIASADTAASAAGLPWAHTVAEIMLGLLGVTVAFFNTRNKRLLQTEIGNHAETQAALGTAEDVGKTLVQNFEQLRQVALSVPGYTRAVDDKVMTAVQVAQEIAGIKGPINDLVDEHTNTTIPG